MPTGNPGKCPENTIGGFWYRHSQVRILAPQPTWIAGKESWDAADLSTQASGCRLAPECREYRVRFVIVRKANNTNDLVAERGGFEPPIRLPVCRISSAVLST